MTTRQSWLDAMANAMRILEHWEQRYPSAEPRPPATADRETLDRLAERLHGNYPFGSPHYAGQMLKPPDPLAWAAVALTMLVNPNNHALDGGPPTAAMEREAMQALADLFGFSADGRPWLGHLTASGTIANLEALWVARECTGGRPIAASSAAHYTHRRMCGVLNVPFVELPVDARGVMNLDALESAIRSQAIGTVVVTLGTTGSGVVEPLADILALCRPAGVRVHVDAAYGGFFRLLAELDPPLVAPADFLATGGADSLVVDPHKHGLQPYGCGAVLFADPAVGRVYAHDSPYTYFTSSELHLGEISLECSRAGAAAAGFWAILQGVGLRGPGSLTERLRLGREAALGWYAALHSSAVVQPLGVPETDILRFVVCSPGERVTSAELSRRSDAVFEAGMQAGPGALFLARMRVARAAFPTAYDVVWDTDEVVVLRSVLMKPEHAAVWPALHARLETLARDAHETG
jgi:glutamate/tyrosine decarboxylase-like PLP-dependent enzyme